MNEVLSQQEIDSLLNALTSGEINPDDMKVEEEKEKNKVKSYDFRRPVKLSKDYVNALHMIFENFSKIAGNSISNLIHSNLEIKIGAVEQVTFDEFIRSIPNPTLIGLFSTKPLSGTQIIEMNPSLCVQIIELMCGGSETEYTKKLKLKDGFTIIEQAILEEVILATLKSFESAWSEVVPVEVSLNNMETSPQLLQSVSPNEPMVLISLIVELLNSKSFMNVCIPFMSLEGILDKLSMKSWFDKEDDSNQETKSIIANRLNTMMVNMHVSLGKSVLTIDEFLGLEYGDVLQLNSRINDPLKLYIEERPYYLVKPGEVDRKFAVEILEYIEEDVE